MVVAVTVARMAIPAADLPAYLADGWTVCHEHAQPERGSDVLIERVSVTLPIGQFVACSVEDCARLTAYAKAIKSNPRAVLSGWIENLATVDVIERAGAL